MRTQTHMLNSNPLRCSAYHEAGHAVVGIARGLKLRIATIRPADGSDPNCRWDQDYIDQMLNAEPRRIRRSFTIAFAEMSLASRYSEALACNIKSDEQRDSHHGDYLGAQLMRHRATREFFSLATVSKLKRRACTLVTQYSVAITAVAERLLLCGGLDQADVKRIIEENPPSGTV
jgi:hypothetical protein